MMLLSFALSFLLLLNIVNAGEKNKCGMFKIRKRRQFIGSIIAEFDKTDGIRTMLQCQAKAYFYRFIILNRRR